MNFDLFGKPILPELQNLRIPYQGSKNGIAPQLFEKMLEIKPRAKYFVDLFGGGASMSFTALQLGMKVIYNEKQTNLVNFIKFIFERIASKERNEFGIFPKEYYEFIDKEKFRELIKQDSNFAQFARICYSFGNNQKSYLFGEVEELKHLAHNVVMFRCCESLKTLNEKVGFNLILSNSKGWSKRRLDLMTQIPRAHELEQLEQLLHLQQLEQLEGLEGLEGLKIINLDFQEVKIDTPLEETIVYLDPPYRGINGYLENALPTLIDDYFINSPYTCFLSEYNAPFDSVLEIEKRALMKGGRGLIKFKTEKLFWNGK